MSATLLLAIVVGLGILMIFIGLARTPQTNTAQMVQQRLQVYGAAGSGKTQLGLQFAQAGARGIALNYNRDRQAAAEEPGGVERL